MKPLYAFLLIALLLTGCASQPATPAAPPGGNNPSPPPSFRQGNSSPPPPSPRQSNPSPPPPSPQKPPPVSPPPSPAVPGSPPPGDSGMEMYTHANSAEVLPQADYLAQAFAGAASQSNWEYQTTLIATAPAGQRFDRGAFCRLFPRPDGDGYDVIFGGAFNIRELEDNLRYQGDVHRLLGSDFTFRTEPELFSTHGGDFAVDSDGQFYYLLNAHPEGWTLGKYDADFNLLKEVAVPLPAGHAGNDQMLRVWEGRVYLSGLYNPDNPEMHSNKDAPPNATIYTHLWIYDTDLNPLEDHILDDEPNINGGTLIPAGEGFAYIAADKFQPSSLYAFLYDADWNFLESKLLREDAQWSMGGTVAEEQIYVAYHTGQHQEGDVWVDIYDTDWTLLDRIQVTQTQRPFNAQRPWVQVTGDRMFVSYDVARDAEGVLDFQCLVSVYAKP